MSEYKIVACDLDGTLLNSNLEVSSENLNGINDLKKMGVDFVPCSGRTICEMDLKIINNPNIRYIIYSNGAGIYDKVNDKKELLCMTRTELLTAYSIIKKYPCYITIRHDGQTYVDKKQQTKEIIDYFKVWFNHQVIVKEKAKVKDNLNEFIENLKDIEVFSLFFNNDKVKNECFNELEKTNIFSPIKICGNGIEVFSKKSGKGNALKVLSKTANVPLENIIAVGDSQNDVSMLTVAGLGLAMKNSEPHVIEFSDKVVCSNDEHVVKYIVENII